MKKRVLLFLQYFLYWYLFFVVCKVFFILYHLGQTKQLAFTDIFRVFIYGSKMDMSMAGYFMVFPGLVFLVTTYFKGKIPAYILNIYTALILLVASFLAIADMELYRFWGFRMDTTPLMYLKNPKEAAGSANIWLSVFLIICWGLFYWFSFRMYLKFIGRKMAALEPANWATSLLFVPLIASLILPIRGSLGVAPMNVGFVYFSKTSVFANHAAINVVWNVAYALTEYDELKPYTYFERKEAEKIFNDTYKDNGKPVYLLNTDRPNIIILILESFTNKIIEPLGGMKGVAPNFNALCKEGILFSNCYSTGDRTDKGIISILNGYPGHPKNAIINFPKKTEKLPYLNLDLKDAGYYNEFVYGYDIDYANFRGYFTNARYDKVVSKDDFAPELGTSKWGVHDHYVFNRLFDEINAAPKQPFFFAFASQSSHEPFEVPMKTVIHGSDDEQKYLNSAYYADSSLGDFIRKAKTTNWWKNTLIVMVADHGIRHPGNTTYNFPAKYNVPMLWLGGALARKDSIISKYLSQSDVPLTLLHQLKLDNKNYKFSQDFLSTNAPGFGFYVFNEGIAFLNKDGEVVFDHTSGRPVIQHGAVDSLTIKAKAQLQVLSTDFSER